METRPERPQIPTIEQWISHLDGLVAGPLKIVPLDGCIGEKRLYVDRFRDEFGSRRSTDRALLSRVLRIGYEPGGIENGDLDHRLWEAVHEADSGWESLISETGGLVEPLSYAIEHRTLIELSAIHALWHLSNGTGIQERMNELVDWHTHELQPDNGINRPWGVHVFVVRSNHAEDETIRLNAMLHAQTLVNNCCITLGKPDVLSALILLDSANALRSLVR